MRTSKRAGTGRATKKKPSSRGKLRSMRSSNSFRDFVLDQLSALPYVRARAMFGGIGLYAADVFFGLIASDVLYLKVDDGNLAQYESEGSQPFRPYPVRAMTMPYYNVPAGVLEDARTLVDWARTSVRIAAAKVNRRRKALPTRRSHQPTK